MAILVVAEHDNKHLKPSVANTVAAATQLGGEISVLVAGSECGDAAAAAAKIPGVTFRRGIVGELMALARRMGVSKD